jgi:hypothetical protein
MSHGTESIALSAIAAADELELLRQTYGLVPDFYIQRCLRKRTNWCRSQAKVLGFTKQELDQYSIRNIMSMHGAGFAPDEISRQTLHHLMTVEYVLISHSHRLRSNFWSRSMDFASDEGIERYLSKRQFCCRDTARKRSIAKRTVDRNIIANVFSILPQ